jgi:hypothetical protein
MNRRQFITTTAVAGAATLLGRGRPPAVAAEPPPETKTIRLTQISGICVAPQYIAPRDREGHQRVRAGTRSGGAARRQPRL